LQTGIHFRFEETEGAATVILGAIERDVGVLEKLLAVRSVLGRDRDADADADGDAMSVMS
jgi:hypothetical protein